jgi:hypothetical protein
VGKPEGRDHLKDLGVDGIIILKTKVKFSLEQAMNAQRGSRGIALLFL